MKKNFEPRHALSMALLAATLVAVMALMQATSGSALFLEGATATPPIHAQADIGGADDSGTLQ
ncbi:MAG: hypothetical protein AAGJ50_05080 [Pseudomonadota bacterium]